MTHINLFGGRKRPRSVGWRKRWKQQAATTHGKIAVIYNPVLWQQVAVAVEQCRAPSKLLENDTKIKGKKKSSNMGNTTVSGCMSRRWKSTMLVPPINIQLITIIKIGSRSEKKKVGESGLFAASTSTRVKWEKFKMSPWFLQDHSLFKNRYAKMWAKLNCAINPVTVW